MSNQPLNELIKFYLVEYDSCLSNYSNKRGFRIISELAGPEMPDGLKRCGKYFVMEIVRAFEIKSCTTFFAEEK